ncbi:MAG: alpha/beta hydrolase [Pseudomonadota bacterium]
MTEGLTRGIEALNVDGAALRVARLGRSGALAPIVFLHGFGSTKEDYADIPLRAAFAGRAVLAYDAPGCGATQCDDLGKIDIPFLVETAKAMIDAAGIDRFHLVGHSMGGLTALMLADAAPERVLSLCSIEGNLAPEDCFLSRQIIAHPAPDAQRFFDGFVARAAASPSAAMALYAAALPGKVRPGAVRGIFRSMVALSDDGALLDRFLALPCPKMLMHGDENAHLTYLPQLRAAGVMVAEIPECGHFPMYSNPPAMWRALAALIDAA